MDTLRNYTFLPWTRRGLSADITVPDDLGSGSAAAERATVSVGFNINAEPIGKDIEVLGPGDVIGINPRAIVKTEPRNWVTDFEANYLPYIEFYEEDFPWRFTPATAANTLEQSRLRPWIFLVVLKESEFLEPRRSGPLPAFELAGRSRSRIDIRASRADLGVGACACQREHHRQLAADAVRPGGSRRRAEPAADACGSIADVASSRLLCARKLEKSTAYHAFVIPAFETGRLAGLGLDIPAGQQRPASLVGRMGSASTLSTSAGSSGRGTRATSSSSSTCSIRVPRTNGSACARWTCRTPATRSKGCPARCA